MILIDLNVLLDVIQARQPHYHASAAVLEIALHANTSAMIPAHAVTTIHYLVTRYNNQQSADEAIRWLMKHLEIAPLGREQLQRAQSLAWPDYEDAVVAATAEMANCDYIITRNVRDFTQSPVSAVTPDEFLATRE